MKRKVQKLKTRKRIIQKPFKEVEKKEVRSIDILEKAKSNQYAKANELREKLFKQILQDESFANESNVIKKVNIHTREGRKMIFLFSYKEGGGCITDSAKVAGIRRETFYAWMKVDPEFKKVFDSICMVPLEKAESKLYRKGVIEGDTACLIFYLKSNHRAKYNPPMNVQVEQTTKTINIHMTAEEYDKEMNKLREDAVELRKMLKE